MATELRVSEPILLRRQQVEGMVGVSRSCLYQMMADDRFPRPLQISSWAVRWKRSDVMAWIESRPTTNETAALE